MLRPARLAPACAAARPPPARAAAVGRAAPPPGARQLRQQPQRRSRGRSAAPPPSPLASLDARRDAASAVAPANACPYGAAKAALGQMLPAGMAPVPRQPAQATAAAPWGPAAALTYLADLAFLARQGVEAASLRFALRAPVVSFPNPLGLGGVSSWKFVSDPALLEHVCAGPRAAQYAARFLPDVYQYATQGLGVLGSQGAYNRAQRRLCGSPFVQGSVSAAGFADAAVAAAGRLGDVWDAAAAARHEPLRADVATHCQRLSLDIIGAVALSHDFRQVATMAEAVAEQGAGWRDDELPSDVLLRHINAAQEAMGRLFVTPMPMLRALSRLGAPPMASLDTALAGMRAEVAPLIAARRAALAASAAPARDLLDALLLARTPAGGALRDDEVWEDVHDVLGAGHETTATAIAAALHALAAHPHIAAELDRHLAAAGVLAADGPARPPTAADVSSGALWYAAAIVKEALRLYPPIPLFPRVAGADDVLPDGTRVAAGEAIFMSAYALGRLPATWGDDVARFDPMRFSPAAEAARHRFAFTPFGAGPRMCLGAGFALTSATLVLATLAARFRVALPPGAAAARRGAADQDKLLRAAYDITLHFPDGVPLLITPRVAPAATAAAVTAR